MEAGTPAIAAALEGVGPRLQRIRTQRGATLAAVAASTGLPKSTLSRLEAGQRRPTLELLLALSHLYRVQLDDLVGAPEVGDSRIHLKPGRVKGRTVLPLTRQPDGMQAWKIVLPTSKTILEPRSHDGHEWIYVLSGHVRVVLGGEAWVLTPGELVEFETQVPHWFGNTGRAGRDPEHLHSPRRTDGRPYAEAAWSRDPRAEVTRSSRGASVGSTGVAESRGSSR